MDIKSFSTQLLRSISSQKVTAFATLLLLCFAANQLAALTWLLVPVKPSSFRWVPERVTGLDSKTQLDLTRLLQLHLFGELETAASKASVPVSAIDAPKTSLKLTLSGIVASSIPEKSLAIVENKGKQQTYGLEETIEGTEAVIKEIQVDRIILLNQGSYESLLLDPDSKAHRKPAAASAQRSNSRPNRPSSREVADDVNVKEVLSDPSKLTDFIRITPVREDGALTGYRINPGKNPDLFTQVGLQANDLAVALNGYDLTDNDQAMQVMQ